MKNILRISIFLVMALALLALPASAFAQTPGNNDGKVVVGGTYLLTRGQTLNGALAVFGGEVTLENGSLVNGDVALIGGTVTIQGEVNGSVNILGGSVLLGDTAYVHGDINTLGGSVNRSPNARVDGSVTSGPSNITVPMLPALLRDLRFNFDPIGQVLWAIFQAVALAAIAVLLAMFLPRPTERVAATISGQPVVMGGIGCLTAIIAPIVILLLAITILLIPISLLLALMLVIAVSFGWIALGTEIGKRMSTDMFHSQWTTPVAAGIGTLSLSLVANLISIVPCIGPLVPALIGIVGLGGVLASRFGTQIYIRPVSYPPAPSAPVPYRPPAPPAPPRTPPPAPPQEPPQDLPPSA